MNEEFAVEPTAFITPGEVKLFIERFGLFEGRYVAKFPNRWEQMLHDHILKWPDGIEQKSATRALELARQEKAFIKSRGRPYDDGASWIENVDVVQASSAPFDHVVVHPRHGDKYPSIARFKFDRNGSFKIPATAAAFVDISRRLLDESAELVLVDQYLNPCKRTCANVLRALLQHLAGEKHCERVDIWVGARIFGEGGRNAYTRDGALKALAQLAGESGFAPRPIRLFVVNAEALGLGREKLDFHARYMISALASLYFDKGFQEIKDRLVPGQINGETLHCALDTIYLKHEYESNEVEEPRETRGSKAD